MNTALTYHPENPTGLTSSIKKYLKGISLIENNHPIQSVLIYNSNILKKVNARLSADIALAKTDITFCLTKAYNEAYIDSTKERLKLEKLDFFTAIKNSPIYSEFAIYLNDYFILNQELYNILISNSLDFTDEEFEEEWGAAKITKAGWNALKDKVKSEI